MLLKVNRQPSGELVNIFTIMIKDPSRLVKRKSDWHGHFCTWEKMGKWRGDGCGIGHVSAAAGNPGFKPVQY
jgi:hypothetical protein